MSVPVGRHKLVVIDEALIARMASNATFVAEFPFLQTVRAAATPTKKSGCGRCAHNKALVAAYARTRATIAGLDGPRKLRLKALLNAHQVRVVYNEPTLVAGKSQARRVEKTF